MVLMEEPIAVIDQVEIAFAAGTAHDCNANRDRQILLSMVLWSQLIGSTWLGMKESYDFRHQVPAKVVTTLHT